ncbi:hypothetical protein BH09ACT13_BH09ACT13_14810 [soil metagenome]
MTRTGQGRSKHPSYGLRVASASAAVPVRLCLAAFVAVLAAFVVTSSADGASRGWSSYLAPSGACTGADDPRASAAVQRGAITCLVNWARRRDGRVLLTSPARVQRAAALKGRGLASCGQLSHTPCGKDASASLEATGYEYGWFGENLFFGPWGEVSARSVVSSWLQSPLHRANVLRPGFRHLGAARVQVSGVFGDGVAAVWVATFASPR